MHKIQKKFPFVFGVTVTTIYVWGAYEQCIEVSTLQCIAVMTEEHVCG